MNIFKILASHDGHIGETNISSFLGYLLDATEDHGLSSNLVSSIVKDFHTKYPKTFSKYFNGWDKLKSSFDNISYSVQQEVRVYPKDTDSGSRGYKDIDIVIEFYDNDEAKSVEYVICLENKITDSSLSPKQLSEEYIGLKKRYEGQDSNPEIYLCFLTPEQSTASERIFTEFTNDCKDVSAIHLFWKGENSIQQKLKNIIALESCGEIDPIPEDSLFMIKSFIAFISSDFSSYIDEKESKTEYKKYGKPVIDYLYDIIYDLDEDKDYKLEKIRKDLSNKIFKESKHEIDKTTLYCDTKMIIVNEKTRVNWGCYTYNANKKDLLYYPDLNDKSIVRKYDRTTNNDIECFYKDK